MRRRAHGEGRAQAILNRDTDCFSSEVEDVDVRGDMAVATIVNRAMRDYRELASRQWLGFRFRDGLIAEISINVDDPAAVERFWAS